MKVKCWNCKIMHTVTMASYEENERRMKHLPESHRTEGILCKNCDELAESYAVPESWCWDGQTEEDY
jgi:hypothetical protein